MNNLVFLTAYDRLTYLQQVLYTWDQARGQENWDFVAMIEPSSVTQQVVEEFEEFKDRTNFRNFTIAINPQVYGVLHHPWVGFERFFGLGQYDFVVRAEDDLVVSDDILEYFDWTSNEYKNDPQVATIHAFTHDDGPLNSVVKSTQFSPWVWGTWKDRWQSLLGPTWDHDYSTYNLYPGNQSGWDWNLNSRVFPQNNLRSVAPLRSRSDNIGVNGIHGTAGNFIESGHFNVNYPPQSFHLLGN